MTLTNSHNTYIILLTTICLILATKTFCSNDSESVYNDKSSIELGQLIDSYASKEKDNCWSWFAEKTSPISWQSDGVEMGKEYYSRCLDFWRNGYVHLTIDGEISHQVLKKEITDGKWNIYLSGSRSYPEQLSIVSDINSIELIPDNILNYLKKNLELEEICKDSEEKSTRLFILNHKKTNKSMRLEYSYSCGSAGCIIEIVITKRNNLNAK